MAPAAPARRGRDRAPPGGGGRARRDAARCAPPCARALDGIGDLERLAGRAALGVAHARDLVGLRASLRALPPLREALAPLAAPLCVDLAAELSALPDLARLLEEALEDEPPRELREGGLIREAWSAELAELRRAARDAKAWIASLEGRERARTGIPSLRVRFNRVFGYSIEVSNPHAAKIPADYVRRQTLVGAERYVTTELKEYESRALGAEERMAALEFELFVEIRARVAAQAEALLRSARAVAALDALAALGEVAHLRGWVRPVVDESRVLEIAAGRHPVIEAAGARAFTPNDVRLDPDATQIVILTGPNMSGKSVFMRQTALLVILAQMGSFVPAASARIGLVDRILTRVGAQDNRDPGPEHLSRGDGRDREHPPQCHRAQPGPPRRGRARDFHAGRAGHRLGGDGGAARGCPRSEGALRHSLSRAHRPGAIGCRGSGTFTWRSGNGTTRSSSSTRCGPAAPTAPTGSRWRGWRGCPRRWWPAPRPFSASWRPSGRR